VVAIPLLLDIADEFRISAGAAGAVVAAYGVPGILVPLLMGPYSDRRGRKRLLVGGSILQGVGTLLAAVAPSFELLVLSRVLGGIGWSLIYPNVSAVVGGSAESGSKGRALSAIIGINTMATIVGVPIAGLVADASTWRSSLGLVAVLGFASAIVVWRSLPADGVQGAGAGTALLYRRIFSSRSASAVLLSSFLGSVFWFTWVTFFVVYFQQTYAMSLSAASTLGLTLGIGILVGSQIGGRLGDRIGHRAIAASAIAVAGMLIALLTNVGLPLALAAALNLLISTLIGARFAANQVLLSDQVPTARGTVFALSSSFASLALVLGAALGGVLVDRSGFGAIGVLCLAVGAVVALITVTFVVEERHLGAGPARALASHKAIPPGGEGVQYEGPQARAAVGKR
jgi:DHA1 family inner membrane transport protein